MKLELIAAGQETATRPTPAVFVRGAWHGGGCGQRATPTPDPQSGVEGQRRQIFPRRAGSEPLDPEEVRGRGGDEGSLGALS